VTKRKIVVIAVGDHCVVIDPIEISRRLRRRVDRAGVSADIAVDVNAAVSTGGEAASRQSAPIRQSRPARAAAAVPDPKEQP
jgi:hypothetical protein